MIWTLLIIAVVTGLASAAFVGIFRVQLLRRGILDQPNERSSHVSPTPRGGGLGVMAALIPAWIIVPFILPAPDGMSSALWLIPLAALFLVGVSWVDDITTLGPLPRLISQFAAALAGAFVIDGQVFQGLLPSPLDPIIAAIGWVWFINLFNFMDGIDGISGIEATAIGLGLLLIGGLGGGAVIDTTHGQALAIAAAAIGFLIWNWPPAKIFLGDCGSVPLGFLLGWLLLSLAANGAWQAAAILPLYYLADATLTLLRRIIRGKKFWRGHRDHFYQAAIKRGLSHGRVSSAIGCVNMLLILLALASVSVTDDASRAWVPWAALGGGLFLVAAFLRWLAGPRSPA